MSGMPIGLGEPCFDKLEAKLADPATYRDRGDDVPALNRDLEAAREQAAALIERWEELEAREEADGR